MPDESRVFDVSKPSKVSPSATSKPVIVGHHPVMNDPMVKDENDFGSESSGETTKIPVFSDSTPTVGDAMMAHENDPVTEPPAQADTAPEEHGSPAVFSEPQEDDKPSDIVPEAGPAVPAESMDHSPFGEATTPEPEHPAEPAADAAPLPSDQPEPHIEGLHFAPAKRKGSRAKWIIAGLLILIIAAYLAIDAGAFGSSVNLPFHIFKQKTQNNTTPPKAQKQPAASGPTIPDGFKEYKISGTTLTFAAPAAWGDPTSTTDPGFSKRSASAQSDGTYAYLVSFAINKDIQIAVTSSKFLPVKRTPLFYDYLQWCTGTNDNQTYQSLLNVTTANGVDTPTTITCNQGPLSNVTKIDSATIMQAGAADSANKPIGDIYTKNLKNDSLVVFRVKDAARTNGADIKQLLSTVQIPAVGGVTTSNSSSNSTNSSSPNISQ